MQGKIQLYVPFPFRIKEKSANCLLDSYGTNYRFLVNAAKVEARDTIYQRMKAGEYIREELTPDGLHPNDKGHKLVAEEIE